MKKLYSIALLIMSASLSISTMEIDDIGVAGDDYGNAEAAEIDNDANNKQKELNKKLLNAIIDGNVNKAKKLLEQGADFRAVNIKGDTPLHYAARKGYVDIVKLFINARADLSAQGNIANTPLHLAIGDGEGINVTKLLIAYGSDVNARDDFGNTPLHLASYKGDTSAIQLLIDAGAEVNAKNDSEETPLSLAAFRGNTDAMQLLIDAGAEVNTKNASEETPLSLAAFGGNIDAMQLLIDTSANVVVKNTDDQVPKKVSTLAELALTQSIKNLSNSDIDIEDKKEVMDSLISTIIELRKEIALTIALQDDDLRDKLLSIIPKIDILKQQRLDMMKSFINHANDSNETALDIAKAKKLNDSVKIIQNIVDTQSFEDLPEKMKRKIESNIIRVFLAGDEKFITKDIDANISDNRN